MALARPAVSQFIRPRTHIVIIPSAIQTKLPPGANRILFVKNLNYQITGEDLYDLFGRYGSIRQIRIGNEGKTKGTAFVVFDDVMDVRNLTILAGQL
jgi:pre-mRNA branch site protein p14